MTTTIKTTPKGAIFETDGYSDFYAAFVQGAKTFKVFIPCTTIAARGVDSETIREFVQDVLDARNEHPLPAFAKGVRILKIARVR